MSNIWEGLQSVRIENQSMRSAFGELVIAPFTPICGWMFPYNINSRLIISTETNGGTVVHSGSFAKLSTGTAVDGFASIETKKHCYYLPGVGSLCRFTSIFSAPEDNSNQLIGIGTQNDGWFFGYMGTEFGILRKKNGSLDVWIPKSSWNVDRAESFDPEKGNVFEIKYQWLGFGMQYFSIEDDNGDLRTVHRIEYANENDDVSVDNPSLPVMAYVENDGNDTDIVLKTPSAVAGINGVDRAVSSVTNGFVNLKSISPGFSYLFSVRNPETFLTKNNRLSAELKLLTIGVEGNKVVEILIYLNSTLTSPSWVDLETGVTPLQSDIVASGISGGALLASFALGKSDSKVIDFSIVNENLDHGDIYSFIIVTSGSSDVSVGTTWQSKI